MGVLIQKIPGLIPTYIEDMIGDGGCIQERFDSEAEVSISAKELVCEKLSRKRLQIYYYC